MRRAIVLNDLLLVKRILRNNPTLVQNPDFDDKSNTSLHLATKYGFLEIVVRSLKRHDWDPPRTHFKHQEFLILAGHENAGISRNTENETPLMIACENKQIEIGKLLIMQFPMCIPEQNKAGMDAVSTSSIAAALAIIDSVHS